MEKVTFFFLGRSINSNFSWTPFCQKKLNICNSLLCAGCTWGGGRRGGQLAQSFFISGYEDHLLILCTHLSSAQMELFQFLCHSETSEAQRSSITAAACPWGAAAGMSWAGRTSSLQAHRDGFSTYASSSNTFCCCSELFSHSGTTSAGKMLNASHGSQLRAQTGMSHFSGECLIAMWKGFLTSSQLTQIKELSSQQLKETLTGSGCKSACWTEVHGGFMTVCYRW